MLLHNKKKINCYCWLNFASNSVLFLFLFSVLWSASARAQIIEEEAQCIDTSASYKRALLSSSRNKSYKFKSAYFTNAITKNDILIDTRIENPNKSKFLDRPLSGLILPVGEIKNKRYLKDQRLVLMGEGWNDETLAYEIDALKQRGFKSVKVLKNGVLSILDNYLLFPYSKSKLSFHNAPADKIITNALLADKEFKSFVFVNLGEVHSVYERLGLQSIHHPFSSEGSIEILLNQIIEQHGKGNERVNIVFSHDDTAIYQSLLKYGQQAKNKANFWFIEGGNEQVYTLNRRLSALVVARNKVRSSCKG